jgi:anti-sigma regulatory factor (Ser/Thr protein kinase)
MGQLRATVRAYARLELGPGELLNLLDAAVRDVSEGTIVTCVYGVCDPVRGEFTYANAGHLPPLLSVPGRPARRLEAGDPPLGSGGYRGAVETVELPPGARLTLYTDGLVEHRGSDIDFGIDLVVRTLAASTDVAIEALPGTVVSALLPAEPDDDVAVLVAEVVTGARRSLTVPISPSSVGVSAVREKVAAALSEWGAPQEVVGDAQLVVSELATNCVRYGAAPMQCQVRMTGDRVVVDVWDASSTRPHVRPFDPSAPNGRGLHLVAGLSSSWGVRPTGGGKAVWAVLPIGG